MKEIERLRKKDELLRQARDKLNKMGIVLELVVANARVHVRDESYLISRKTMDAVRGVLDDD